jgi:hypothetical protein
MVTTPAANPLQKQRGVFFVSIYRCSRAVGAELASAAADIGHLVAITVTNCTLASSGSVAIGSSARRLYDGKCGRDGGLNPRSDIDEYFICQHRVV